MKLAWKGVGKAGLAGAAVVLGVAVFAAQGAYALGTVGTVTPASPSGGSDTNLGTLALSPTSGKSFAFCSGNSQNAPFTTVNSYLTQGSPSALTYNGAGTILGTGNFQLKESSNNFNAVVGPINTTTSDQINPSTIPTDVVFGDSGGGAPNFTAAQLLVNGGVWNVGIDCAQVPTAGGNATVSDYWNTVCTFTASTSDRNGYTYSCTSGGSGNVPEAPLAIGLPLGGAAVVGGTVVYFHRRRRGGLSAPGAAA
jgi:hypothetical protein